MNVDSIKDNKAEAVVISTLLYHPEFLAHSSSLRERCFYNMDNKLMFWAISKLFKEQHVSQIGALELENVINSNGSVRKEWQKCNNVKSTQEYIDFANNSKTDDVQAYKMYVKRLLDLSVARDIIQNCEATASYVMANNDAGVEKLSSKVYKDIQDIVTQYITHDEVSTIGKIGTKIWDDIQKRKAAGEMNGFPSIFPTLKSYFIYQKQEMVLVGARMKTGKSIFGMLEALNAAQHGIQTLVYDSEMSDKLFYLRVLSHYTGIPPLRLENEQLTGDENLLVENAMKAIEKLPLTHVFNPSMNMDQLYSLCYQQKIQNGLEFVIYDYIKGGDEVEASRRSNQMGAMTDFLKNKIGGELDLAVLAFAQVGRSGEIAESDAIERYCSVSCNLFKKTPEQILEDGADCGTMGLLVKLNRLGPSMMESEYLDLQWAKGLTIQEAARHDSGSV